MRAQAWPVARQATDALRTYGAALARHGLRTCLGPCPGSASVASVATARDVPLVQPVHCVHSPSGYSEARQELPGHGEQDAHRAPHSGYSVATV